MYKKNELMKNLVGTRRALSEKDKGITLIALVITIIVLLILAAVTLNITLGENGIFTKARTSKNSYEYSSAKETLNLKLMEIKSDCIEKNQEYTLEKIANTLGQPTEKTIEILKYYGQSAQVNANTNTKPEPADISGIVVTVKPYTQYKFLIGEDQYGSYAITEVAMSNAEFIDKSDFNKIEDFEKNVIYNDKGSASQNENLSQQIPNPAYEGVGYKFIYDGSLGEDGAEGANLQNDFTGGWDKVRTTISCDNGKHYYWYIGTIYTKNKINLSSYSRLYFNTDLKDYGGASICGGQIQSIPDRYIMSETYMPTDEHYEFAYNTEGKNIGYLNLPSNWNGYIALQCHHSTDNTWSYGFEETYINNTCDNNRYVRLYEMIAVKEDDWRQWARLGNIDITNENYDTLEEILENETILQQIYSNNEANSYLMKCTGTLMMEILRNEKSFENIPNDLKIKIKNNSSWNKIATVFEIDLE